MPQMRLCAVADVDAQLCAQDPLLPLPRLGRVAPSRRLSVRLPTDPPGPARSDRVARGHPPDRGPDAHPGGTRPAPRRSPRGRTDEAAARRSRTRANADQEEHGTPGHGLPGGPLTPRRTAAPNAGTARPRTVRTGGIAGHPRSGCRPDVVPAPRRNPGRLPSGAARVGAITGDRRSPKNRPPPCQRHPGGQ